MVAALKPIQMASFRLESFLEMRKEFTTMEWMGLLLRSIGFNPDKFSFRKKLLQVTRLIPFCERNYNLIELGPKGTGKSHIYTEFSPHGMLISGSEVTAAKLFVDNSKGQIGLFGYWDCVAFDEFAGRQKSANKVLVDTMKNYMANKSFSHGKGTMSAEASMVFVGNTSAPLETMLLQSDLFVDLPQAFYDSAFLDRLHCYLPGWEVEILRKDLFTDDYGFIVDYMAELLHTLRNYDYTTRYRQYFELSPTLTTRDRDGINKTFSGLMKLMFPGGEASQEEMEVLLQVAMEGRKRVKDQNMRIDATYAPVAFEYKTPEGSWMRVQTKEEKDFPDLYHHARQPEDGEKEGINPRQAPQQNRRQQQSRQPPRSAEEEKTFLQNRNTGNGPNRRNL